MTRAGAPEPAKYASGEHRLAAGREMRVLLVLTIMLMAAATAFAYGRAEMAASVSVVVAHTPGVALTEPLTMLLSGGLMLVLAGAVRRIPL